MIAGYLLDEQLPLWWRRAIVRLQPQLRVWRVGDPGAPSLGTPDPAILEWCEGHNFILVTNNRKSMPQHLADHLAQGRHIPGIFLVDLRRHIRQFAQDLALIAGASFEDEYRDQIQVLPEFH